MIESYIFAVRLSETVLQPSFFTPEERAPSMHWIRGWVGPRVGLDDMEK
jgi:hypothetical protein